MKLLLTSLLLAVLMGAAPWLHSATRGVNPVMPKRSAWPIQEPAVRRAISQSLEKQGAGSLPDGASISWPEFQVATEPDPRLQVTRTHWNVWQKTLEVNLRCVNRQSCGSVLVRVTWPPSAPEPLQGSRLRPDTFARTGSIPASARLVDRGKPATLILEDTTMRISMPVICLEPGGLNQRIRVLDQQSRKVFLAEVAGDHLLHAAF
jgi:hypothetical protein